MRIELKKFGNLLVSRPAGRDAHLSARAYLLPAKDSTEPIEIDFSGVAVLAPSWADEFITPLRKSYSDRLTFLPCDNPTVKATLEAIEAE